MSHYKELTRVDQLRIEHPNLDNYILSLTDIIAKLEVNNIELTNKVISLEKEKAEFTSCTSRVYSPNKSYKELEDKLALAENSKQTAIDKLYETKIGPLQNKVKDQHIQLESVYKRETRLTEEISHLKKVIDRLDTIVNYAAGYISACEQFRDKHPNDVKNWLFEGLK
jgi:predicted RNase H-like nuclease (RuvC/YqgF family)